MSLKLPKIYPITDTRISGLSHLEQVRRLIDGGATLIQLREKHAPAREFYAAALETIAFAREQKVMIVINDRVDIAVATGADGVHLGQDDLDPTAARRMLGENRIIGYSTHSIDQARAAVDLPIDYIAIGPIFGTSTKQDPDPVVGVEGISDVRKVIGDIPLVAIGGINRANVRQVIKSGADAAAVISDLLTDPNRIAERMANFLALTR